ncbi:MAG TPA: CsgG/HfaB family protein, partial [Spirochaetota bacterium]|nr:CsgG/HfaB family protein [Spirochaetota bacterium]
MKYLVLLLSISMMFSCGSAKKKEQRAQRAKSQEIVQNANKLIVIVSDPTNRSGDRTYDTITEDSTTAYTSRLVKTDTFRVIERQRLKEILDELKLSMTGLVDASNMKQAGKILGADATVFIELSSVNYTSDSTKIGSSERITELIVIEVTARIVDIETGEILASTSTTNQAKNSFTKLGNFAKTDSPIDKLDFV